MGLGFNNPVGKGGVLDMCLCFGCGGGEWVGDWPRVWRGGVVLCLCELSVWILCVDGRSRYLCSVLGASEVHPVFNPVAPYGYLLPNMYSRYRKSRLVCLMLSDLDSSRHHPLL